MQPPFLARIQIIEDKVPSWQEYPFCIPFVRDLDFSFSSPVTFLVGENGTGKSTLLEAIASLSGLPVSGGSKNDLGIKYAPEEFSPLSNTIRGSFKKKPKDGFFLRAEFHAHFASLLDARKKDPDFFGDPYAAYGGRSLHTISHGEAFLAVLLNRLHKGIFLFDEPEAALSPQRQLALLLAMHDLVLSGECQFIIATHSPILLTFPGSKIVSFDHTSLQSITLEETSHFQITKEILQNPEKYWHYLTKNEKG